VPSPNQHDGQRPIQSIATHEPIKGVSESGDSPPSTGLGSVGPQSVHPCWRRVQTHTLFPGKSLPLDIFISTVTTRERPPGFQSSWNGSLAVEGGNDDTTDVEE
jgi:hypothetical protein